MLTRPTDWINKDSDTFREYEKDDVVRKIEPKSFGIAMAMGKGYTGVMSRSRVAEPTDGHYRVILLSRW